MSNANPTSQGKLTDQGGARREASEADSDLSQAMSLGDLAFEREVGVQMGPEEEAGCFLRSSAQLRLSFSCTSS